MEEHPRRDYYFDNLKFVLIALVVVGHVLEPLRASSSSAKSVYTFIYFFHMPLFVFVTGYFSKKLDKLSHLVALYLIFESLYSVADFYVNSRSHLHFSFSLPYWVTWYLLAAILWKLILPFFIRLKYPVLMAGILAVFAGYSSLGYTMSALRAVNFFPFFLAGYYMKREYFRFLFTLPLKIAAVCMLVTAVYVIYRFGDSINAQWLWGSYSYKAMGHAEWYAGLYRLAVACVTILMSASVLSVVPERRTLVSELGSRTMYPFLLHGFLVIYAVHAGLYQYIHTAPDELWLIVAAIMVTVVLAMEWVEKSMRWLFRPKLSFLYKKQQDASTRTSHT